jgi:hypothetical protein
MQWALCEAMDKSETPLRKALKTLGAEAFDPN